MSHNIETEILNYNFAAVGIQHKKDVEHTDLPSLLKCLKEYCITRDSPLWQPYSIEGVIRKGGEKYHKLGSKQTQFCKYCGETIYFDLSGRSSNTTIPERDVSDYKDLG
jgi:hypothetical protein